MRLDAGFRVDPSNHSLRARYDGGAWSTLALTDGLYLNLDALLAEFETQLQTVSASVTATHASGVVTLAWAAGHTLSVDWLCPTLRDWLGWANAVTGTTSGAATAPGPCLGVFSPSLPWDDPSPIGWDLTLLRSRHPSGRSRSYRRGYRRRFGVTAVVLFGELAQFRGVLRELARGVPGTLWRDASNATPWAYDEWWGVISVQLAGDGYKDAFPEAQSIRLTLALDFTEYSP